MRLVFFPNQQVPNQQANEGALEWARTFTLMLNGELVFMGPEALGEGGAGVGAGISERAMAVVEYASLEKADLLLIPGDVHVKLTEKILRNSKVPVLRIPDASAAPAAPAAHVAGDSGVRAPLRILFPTDFHPEARPVLGVLGPFARQLGASITVFHELPRPAGYFGQNSFAKLVAWDEDRKERRYLSELFLREIRAMGVDAHLELSPPGKPLVERILETAARSAYFLIAVGSRSGPVEAYFTGLITRQLLSQAKCPVWAIHVKNLEKGARIEAA